MTMEKWKLKDRTTLKFIRLTLPRNVVFKIVKEKTTLDFFKTLSNIYEKTAGYEHSIFGA